MSAHPPRILFVALADDVGSDRIVAEMGRLGCVCAVLGPRDGFAGQVRAVDALFVMPRTARAILAGVLLAGRLRRIVRRWRPERIVPLDDLSARLLRDRKVMRAAGPDVGRIVATTLGTDDRVVHRAESIEVAAAAGLRTPRQRRVGTLEEATTAAADFGYPLVLKRDQTCGGFGVAIVADGHALAQAFSRERRKAVVKRRLQQMVGLATTRCGDIVVQQHVVGQTAFMVAACAQGKLLECVGFAQLRVDPPVTGASTILAPFATPEMHTTTAALVAELGCSGFVSLDFIVTPCGGAYLIEINARPVASGHLGRLYGHDLYAAYVAQLRDRQSSVQTVIGPARLALFPRELARDPGGAGVEEAGVYHDVPWDEPAVIRASVDWLCRRHPSAKGDLHQRFGLATVDRLADRRSVRQSEPEQVCA